MDLPSDRPPPRAPLPTRPREPMTIDARPLAPRRRGGRAALAAALTLSGLGAALGVTLAPGGPAPIKAAWEAFHRALADTGRNR